MVQLKEFEKIPIKKAIRDKIAEGHDLLFALQTANLFCTTFSNYEGSLYRFHFNDGSHIAFPLVKLPTRLTILNSLPYSWHSAIHLSSGESLGHKLHLITKALKPHVLHFSFSTPVQTELRSALKHCKYHEDEISSYITSLGGRTFEEIFEKDFSSKTRNQCRKALKSGLSIEKTSATEQDIDAYYSLYKGAASHWDKSYTAYPKSFYKELAHIGDKFVDFWAAKLEGRLIGGIFVLKYHGWVYYWAGMTDREYSRYCANNGLLYHAIRHYSEAGYHYFDYGPSKGLGNVDKFKKGFGPTVHCHTHYHLESPVYKHILKPLSALRSKLKNR